jgi:hypothetical protein
MGAEHDLWAVSVEQEYHEEKRGGSDTGHGAHGTGRDAPVLPRREPVA